MSLDALPNEKITPQEAARLFLTPRRRPTPVAAMPDGAQAMRIEAAGEDIAAWRWGAGSNVLLVHGWEADHSDMLGFIAPLLGAGLAPIAFDLPAHGRSTGTEASIPHMARALADVARAVGPIEGIIAHSIGCAVTICALADGMEASRAVLLAAPLRYSWYAWHAAKAMGLDEAEWEQMRLALLDAGTRLDEMHNAKLGPSLTQPALFMHSGDDRVVPVDHGMESSGYWKGAAFRRLEGLGHRRILTDEAVIAAAIDFIASEG